MSLDQVKSLSKFYLGVELNSDRRFLVPYTKTGRCFLETKSYFGEADLGERLDLQKKLLRLVIKQLTSKSPLSKWTSQMGEVFPESSEKLTSSGKDPFDKYLEKIDVRSETALVVAKMHIILTIFKENMDKMHKIESHITEDMHRNFLAVILLKHYDVNILLSNSSSDESTDASTARRKKTSLSLPLHRTASLQKLGSPRSREVSPGRGDQNKLLLKRLGPYGLEALRNYWTKKLKDDHVIIECGSKEDLELILAFKLIEMPQMHLLIQQKLLYYLKKPKNMEWFCEDVRRNLGYFTVDLGLNRRLEKKNSLCSDFTIETIRFREILAYLLNGLGACKDHPILKKWEASVEKEKEELLFTYALLHFLKSLDSDNLSNKLYKLLRLMNQKFYMTPVSAVQDILDIEQIHYIKDFNKIMEYKFFENKLEYSTSLRTHWQGKGFPYFEIEFISSIITSNYAEWTSKLDMSIIVQSLDEKTDQKKMDKVRDLLRKVGFEEVVVKPLEMI